MKLRVPKALSRAAGVPVRVIRHSYKVPVTVLGLGYKVPVKVLSYGYKDIIRRRRYHGYRLEHKPYATLREASRPVQVIERSARIEHLHGGDVVTHIDVALRHAPDGLTILHLSDLHFAGKRSRKLAVASAYLTDREFDLVFITGDLVHRSTVRLSEQERAFLSGLRARLGKFYVYGDHERQGSGHVADVERQLSECGLVNLTNSLATIKLPKATLTILGLDDIKLGNPNDAVAKNLAAGHCNIALMHNLDALSSRVPRVLDLVLSGHLHAGEFALGRFDGTALMRLEQAYHNLNRHKGAKAAFAMLTSRTLSYSNPGFHSYLKDTYRLRRFNTRTQGFTILTLRKK
jgi:predicted MPP superfamily phosphohydrolase